MNKPVVPRSVLFLSNAKQSPSRPATEGPDPGTLAARLASHGFRATERRLNEFPINPFAGRGTFYAGFDIVRAIAVLLMDRHVDIIVSIGESNVALILLLARILRFKPRIVLREISPRGWKKRDLIVDFVLPRVDRILLLTPHQKVWVEANYKLKAPPDVVGFAIDEVFFTPKECRDGGYILAVGDDVGRDYACLIAACRDTPFKLLLRTGSNLVIPDDMTHRVTILGRLSYPKLRDLYAEASIVVVPLLDVDHPSGITTLYEAMAMGCAVVASDVGSTRHAVQDGKNGRLVTVGDRPAMCAAIIALMGDETLRRRLGQNARATIENEFSYTAYVQRFAASLRSVLAEE